MQTMTMTPALFEDSVRKGAFMQQFLRGERRDKKREKKFRYKDERDAIKRGIGDITRLLGWICLGIGLAVFMLFAIVLGASLYLLGG